jgi:hypothetical protein
MFREWLGLGNRSGRRARRLLFDELARRFTEHELSNELLRKETDGRGWARPDLLGAVFRL